MFQFLIESCNNKIVENQVFQIGELVWAQVSRYPYWPAIICTDPVTNKHLEQGETLVSIISKMHY